MSRPLSIHEYTELARTHLPQSTWDYFAGGSEDERTLRDNEAAFASMRLRPRVLVDVSRCSVATTVLGEPVQMPVLVAPMGCQQLAHPEGDCAMARAAHRAGTVMAVSTMATSSLETIAGACDGKRWFQLYIYRDRAVTEALVRRADAAGYRALMVTVDTPRMGRRERDIRNGFGLPPGLSFANFANAPTAHTPAVQPGASGLAAHTNATFDDAFTWRDLAWLRSQSDLPIVLKGILTAEDARLAVEHGVDAVVVSNHGGRQLDGVPATLAVLEEVVDAVAGRCEVYLDGGIRRGTDVVKALALGARAVLVGRPLLWGLALHGEDGAYHVLSLLRAELELALALAGAPALEALNRSFVRRGH